MSDTTLSPEDDFRLQILLHNGVRAVRLDEPSMTLYALTEQGEASIPLSPNSRTDHYVQGLKKILSQHALGNEGGYPNYLRRWNRLESNDHQQLAALLLLGEHEAVVAVANSSNITLDVAKDAWWCAMNSESQHEVAYHLLSHDCVRTAPLGRELVVFLLEYLPFMIETGDILRYLSMMIASGQMDDNEQQAIWQRGGRKAVFGIAFLVTSPYALPGAEPSHHDANESLDALLQRTHAPGGQAFLLAVKQACSKLSSEELVYPLLNAIGAWFAPARVQMSGRDYLAYQRQVEAVLNGKCAPQHRAMHLLAGINEQCAFDAVLHTGAVGSQLRRKLMPLLDVILEWVEELL
jgi:hypothetical protein